MASPNLIETYRTCTEPVEGNCTICHKTLAQGRVVTANHESTEHPKIHAQCVEKLLQRTDGILRCRMCNRIVDLNSVNGNFDRLREKILTGALTGVFISALIKGVQVALPLLHQNAAIFLFLGGIGGALDTLVYFRERELLPFPLEHYMELAAIAYEFYGVKGITSTGWISFLLGAVNLDADPLWPKVQSILLGGLSVAGSICPLLGIPAALIVLTKEEAKKELLVHRVSSTAFSVFSSILAMEDYHPETVLETLSIGAISGAVGNVVGSFLRYNANRLYNLRIKYWL